jgi:hypothetical protein
MSVSVRTLRNCISSSEYSRIKFGRLHGHNGHERTDMQHDTADGRSFSVIAFPPRLSAASR